MLRVAWQLFPFTHTELKNQYQLIALNGDFNDIKATFHRTLHSILTLISINQQHGRPNFRLTITPFETGLKSRSMKNMATQSYTN